jgi:hypothetical protein
MAPEDEQASALPATDAKPVDTSNEKNPGSATQETADRQDTDPRSENAGATNTEKNPDQSNKPDGSAGNSQRRLSNSASETGKPEFSNGDSSSDDENIVFWDNDTDPHNPYNWPTWLKVFNCVLISALTFVTPLASCTQHTLVYILTGLGFIC